MARTLERLGSRLKLLRLGRGLSQAQLAARTGGILCQARLSQLENGSRPRLAERAALAGIFGLPADEMFPE